MTSFPTFNNNKQKQLDDSFTYNDEYARTLLTGVCEFSDRQLLTPSEAANLLYVGLYKLAYSLTVRDSSTSGGMDFFDWDTPAHFCQQVALPDHGVDLSCEGKIVNGIYNRSSAVERYKALQYRLFRTPEVFEAYVRLVSTPHSNSCACTSITLSEVPSVPLVRVVGSLFDMMARIFMTRDTKMVGGIAFRVQCLGAHPPASDPWLRQRCERSFQCPSYARRHQINGLVDVLLEALSLAYGTVIANVCVERYRTLPPPMYTALGLGSAAALVGQGIGAMCPELCAHDPESTPVYCACKQGFLDEGLEDCASHPNPVWKADISFYPLYRWCGWDALMEYSLFGPLDLAELKEAPPFTLPLPELCCSEGPLEVYPKFLHLISTSSVPLFQTELVSGRRFFQKEGQVDSLCRQAEHLHCDDRVASFTGVQEMEVDGAASDHSPLTDFIVECEHPGAIPMTPLHLGARVTGTSVSQFIDGYRRKHKQDMTEQAELALSCNPLGTAARNIKTKKMQTAVSTGKLIVSVPSTANGGFLCGVLTYLANTPYNTAASSAAGWGPQPAFYVMARVNTGGIDAFLPLDNSSISRGLVTVPTLTPFNIRATEFAQSCVRVACGSAATALSLPGLLMTTAPSGGLHTTSALTSIAAGSATPVGDYAIPLGPVSTRHADPSWESFFFTCTGQTASQIGSFYVDACGTIVGLTSGTPVDICAIASAPTPYSSDQSFLLNMGNSGMISVNFNGSVVASDWKVVSTGILFLSAVAVVSTYYTTNGTSVTLGQETYSRTIQVATGVAASGGRIPFSFNWDLNIRPFAHDVRIYLSPSVPAGGFTGLQVEVPAVGVKVQQWQPQPRPAVLATGLGSNSLITLEMSAAVLSDPTPDMVEVLGTTEIGAGASELRDEIELMLPLLASRGVGLLRRSNDGVTALPVPPELVSPKSHLADVVQVDAKSGTFILPFLASAARTLLPMAAKALPILSDAFGEREDGKPNKPLDKNALAEQLTPMLIRRVLQAMPDGGSASNTAVVPVRPPIAVVTAASGQPPLPLKKKKGKGKPSGTTVEHFVPVIKPPVPYQVLISGGVPVDFSGIWSVVSTPESLRFTRDESFLVEVIQWLTGEQVPSGEYTVSAHGPFLTLTTVSATATEAITYEQIGSGLQTTTYWGIGYAKGKTSSSSVDGSVWQICRTSGPISVFGPSVGCRRVEYTSAGQTSIDTRLLNSFGEYAMPFALAVSKVGGYITSICNRDTRDHLHEAFGGSLIAASLAVCLGVPMPQDVVLTGNPLAPNSQPAELTGKVTYLDAFLRTPEGRGGLVVPPTVQKFRLLAMRGADRPCSLDDLRARLSTWMKEGKDEKIDAVVVQHDPLLGRSTTVEYRA